jgi:hypothetical protein
MIPEFTIAHATLAEQRIRDAARDRALDRPDLVYRDPDRVRWTAVRAALRQIARAVRPRERSPLAAPGSAA